MARRARIGPYDATYEERDIVRLALEGEIRIDEEGRIWRVAIRQKGKLYPCVPRRAEHRTRDGYLEFRPYINGRRYYVQAHRLVYQYFYGDIPEGKTIDHKNGVQGDNRPSNLVTANMSEQTKRSFVLGNRSFVGEKNNNATVSDAQVREIRLLYAGGWRQKRLAEQYGISPSQVSRIVRGKSRDKEAKR
jgi:hypothetical protein